MIPLYLKISGVYSYRETQEIDFQTLTASHLFGIFGAVGSGKSALLETILFALYGETERLNSREQRAYNMMNLKSNEAFIQFDFRAPGNKGEYRAIAKGKRNSRNKEDVKFERFAYKKEASGLIPVDTSTLPSILGISHDHFRRTIIIPQGTFQEFLQLGAKERTEMVRELFNLQRFDLSFKTGRLQKKNEESINLCQGKLQQIGVISEDDLRIKQEELDLVQLAIQSSEKQLIETELSEKACQQLAELSISIQLNQAQLKTLQNQLPEIQKAEQILKDFDDCVLNFKTDFELLDDKRRQWETENTLLQARKQELIKATTTAGEARTRFDEARKAFDGRELILRKANDLKACAGINILTKETTALGERILNGEQLLLEKNRDHESLKTQASLLRANQETLRSQLPALEKLKATSEWYSALNLLRERKTSFVVLQNAAREGLLESETTLLSCWALTGQSTPENLDDYGVLAGLLQSEKEKSQLQLNELQSRLMHLEVSEKLKSYSGNLEDGKPCPLCGSLEHPRVMEVGDFSREKEQLKMDIIHFETIARNQELSLSNLESLRKSRTARQGELESNRLSLAELEKSLLEQEKHHPWPGINEEGLVQQWAQYNKIQGEIDSLDQWAREAQLKSDEAAESAKKYSEALAKLKEELLVKDRDIANYKARVTLVDPEEYAGTTPEAILEQSEGLLEQYRLCEENYKQLEKVLQDAHNSQLMLEGVIRKTEESQLLLEKLVFELSLQLGNRIKGSRFGEEGVIRNILTSDFNRQKEQERIRLFRNTIETLVKTLDQQSEQLDGRAYDADQHEKMKAALAEIKTGLDQKREQKGGLENELQKLKQNFETSIRLRNELKILEIRKENLKTLADLFRAQGFVNFVSTRYLHNLVNSANERFYRLTRQQLKLELDPENNFRIRDYLNDGQWRNVKTLSGGQTFQASLCLALALADNIQQLNQGGQNFFFLDEGFGTLDKESLELVFDTLKSLRKENRIVGVISHVEEMQQEIMSWLKITNHEETGSRIVNSWT